MTAIWSADPQPKSRLRAAIAAPITWAEGATIATRVVLERHPPFAAHGAGQ